MIKFQTDLYGEDSLLRTIEYAKMKQKLWFRKLKNSSEIKCRYLYFVILKPLKQSIATGPGWNNTKMPVFIVCFRFTSLIRYSIYQTLMRSKIVFPSESIYWNYSFAFFVIVTKHWLEIIWACNKNSTMAAKLFPGHWQNNICEHSTFSEFIKCPHHVTSMLFIMNFNCFFADWLTWLLFLSIPDRFYWIAY